MNTKVKMIETASILRGTSYTIKVKKWFGWTEPDINGNGGATFFDKANADKWFLYLSGQKDTHKIIKTC